MHSVQLRAHHLLCIQGFQGYGYSRDFTDNMARVTRCIKTNPDLPVEIVGSCDVICGACPHNREDMCVREEGSQQKVSNMDRQVLEKLGLREGETIRAGDISRLTGTKLQNSDIEEICGGCDWKKTCLFFASRCGNLYSLDIGCKGV
jgi:hypothetical protein